MLGARDAARALANGFRDVGWECDELPVADGGEGTLDALGQVTTSNKVAEVHDAFGLPRRARWMVLADGTAVVEAAEAIPLDPARLDVRSASSRGLGELLREVCGSEPRALTVALGGTANMDAGAGMLDVLESLPVPTRVACDVRTTLVDAPRLFGPQKGATDDDVRELTDRFAAHPFAHVEYGGAAGGLGAAFASLGAKLVSGAELVLELLQFDPHGYDVVVTGEGTVDQTTWEGKAPAAVLASCERARVPCVLFGGRVIGGDAVPLSGDASRAHDDLVTLARRLSRLRGS